MFFAHRVGFHHWTSHRCSTAKATRLNLCLPAFACDVPIAQDPGLVSSPLPTYLLFIVQDQLRCHPISYRNACQHASPRAGLCTHFISSYNILPSPQAKYSSLHIIIICFFIWNQSVAKTGTASRFYTSRPSVTGKVPPHIQWASIKMSWINKECNAEQIKSNYKQLNYSNTCDRTFSKKPGKSEQNPCVRRGENSDR